MLSHAIVTCVTADWMPVAAVTLLSCVTHGKVQDADLVMCVHKPSLQNLADLAQFNRRHNINITARAVDATELRAIESGPLNIGTLIRLGIDRYLPPTYQRVLYLDSDVLVRRPLAPLFATAMDGFAVAAVTDYLMHSKLYGVLTSNLETIGFGEDDAGQCHRPRTRFGDAADGLDFPGPERVQHHPARAVETTCRQMERV
jgi:lipopolysaccharide biosynthesis glycosyltransferase